MLNSIRSKQVMITVAIVLLTAFLFSRDIKGLVKPKQETSTVPASRELTQEASDQINLTEISVAAKSTLTSNVAAEIGTLEEQYKTAAEQDQAAVAKLLAQKWDDVEQPVQSALYLEIVANKAATLGAWLSAGDQFLKAFDNTRDSVLLPALLQKANSAFKNAMAIDSTSNDAKTGLGITIVNGMGMPMQGIAMLMDVVKRDPKNLKANMSLGTFAIKSGQFDKAIIRFKDIIAIKASPDAYFYLGTAYENLGRNNEAVDAYLKSKKLASNPTLSKFIDNKVLELNSKN